MTGVDQAVIDAVRQRIFDRYGRAVTFPSGTDESIDEWATENGNSHADYDHYIQNCEDCQKHWIRLALEAYAEIGALTCDK